MQNASETNKPLVISIADSETRMSLYRLRHDVYATELKQYPCSVDGTLRDDDQIQSVFISATFNQQLIGFIGVTLPTSPRFSLDKHMSRGKWIEGPDGPWFEIRTLTVAQAFRRFRIAGTLMYAAFRYVEALGGNALVSMGRREVIELYLRFGFLRTGLSSQCGDVTYDLMTASITGIAKNLTPYRTQLTKIQQRVDWQLPIKFDSP